MPSWTDAQRAAINARNNDVLVSAAAGSGKTAVLVERVLSLMTQGVPIDHMLVCTFTRAAAAEMRARLTDKVKSVPALRAQESRVERADICTLHVFCSRIIREYFQFAGVDPMARLGETPQTKALFSRALEDAMEEMYASREQNAQLMDCFDDAQIESMLRALYPFLMAKADPEAWLEAQNAPLDEASLPDCLWVRALFRACALALDEARASLSRCDEILSKPGAPVLYEETYRADRDLLCVLQDDIARGAPPLAPAFARLPTKKQTCDEQLKADYQKERDAFKKLVKDACGSLPPLNADTCARANAMLDAQRSLQTLFMRTRTLYQAYKAQKGLLDYNDLEHFALAALRNDRVARDVAAHYRALFIDEYQDVSPIQEAIISRVHLGNMLFMVGDIKQSIYRFRQADPTLFLHKYQTFLSDEDADARRITLQKNFRSRGNVLRAVNHVFAHAMRGDVTEIDYDDEAALVPGRESANDPPVCLHIITPASAPETPEDDEDDDGEQKLWYLFEAQQAARIIQDLMTKTVTDKNGQTRAMRYRDIVILLRRASGRAPQMARVLQARGIPCYSDASAQYFDLPEISDMLSLLHVLDNPYQDVPLLCVLHSPTFSFSGDELARVRLCKRDARAFYEAFEACSEEDTPLGARCAQVKAQLSQWRALSRMLPVGALLWRLLSESGCYLRAGAQEGGDMRRANLRLLCERAGKADPMGGLHGFLRFVEQERQNDDGMSAKTLGENEDVVRILTLHKSKGLEFPAVLMLGLAEDFTSHRDSSPLVLHPRGLSLPFIDAQKHAKGRSPKCDGLNAQRLFDARAEEARLMYVGMTRAMEYLYLLASPNDEAKFFRVWSRRDTQSAAGSAKHMIDWAAQALYDALKTREDTRAVTGNGAVFDVYFHQSDEYRASEPPQAAAIEPGDVPVSEMTAARLSYVPQIEARAQKTSVTALVRRLQEEEETEPDKREPLTERAGQVASLPDRPAYMTDASLTAAERGTATHRALCCLPLDALKNAPMAAYVHVISQALEGMRASGRLTQTEYDAIDRAALAAFFTSPTGQGLLRADVQKREWSFTLRAGTDDTPMLVQGMIDCCYLDDGEWVLVDYKTDACAAEELPARYGEQMRWYARALREITGKPVRQIVLYSLRHRAAVAVGNAPVV